MLWLCSWAGAWLGLGKPRVSKSVSASVHILVKWLFGCLPHAVPCQNELAMHAAMHRRGGWVGRHVGNMQPGSGPPSHWASDQRPDWPPKQHIIWPHCHGCRLNIPMRNIPKTLIIISTTIDQLVLWCMKPCMWLCRLNQSCWSAE